MPHIVFTFLLRTCYPSNSTSIVPLLYLFNSILLCPSLLHHLAIFSGHTARDQTRGGSVNDLPSFLASKTLLIVFTPLRLSSQLSFFRS